MSPDLFDLSFKPFPVLVHQDRDAVENTFEAKRILLAIPSDQNGHPPDRSVCPHCWKGR